MSNTESVHEGTEPEARQRKIKKEDPTIMMKLYNDIHIFASKENDR